MIGQRPVSKLLLLFALGAALMLAGCAGVGNAARAGGSLGALNLGGATPDAQGFVLAGQITPAPAGTNTGGNGGAPALFGGRIESMVTNGGESVWQVSGRAVHVTSSTTINDAMGRPQVGSHVTIGGTPRNDGGADAAWVRVDDAGSGASPAQAGGSPATAAGAGTSANSAGAATQAPAGDTTGAGPATAGNATTDTGQADNAQNGAATNAGANENSQAGTVYCGYVEQLPQRGIVGDWRVSNRTVHVSQATRVQAQDNHFELGWFAYIRGALQNDGSFNAQQIYVRPPGNNRCLPGLRVGQNNGKGQGNDNGNGNGNGAGKGNPGRGNGNGKGPKGGNGKGN